jgi:predicted DNA-binding antitoxin AbrB/MazE fold protein
MIESTGRQGIVMMSTKARFEGGVLRPMDKLDLVEGSVVEVAIIPAEWSQRLRSLLERVRQRGKSLSPEEIEAEITRAAEEVREQRLPAS